MLEAPERTSLGNLRVVCKLQLITVVLDMRRRRVDPGAFQSIKLNISGIFYVSNQTSASS